LATPAKTPPLDSNGKATVLMAVSQLDMLIIAFGSAPEKVLKAAKDFRAALEEWANG
jgi:hypothetical protein